MDQNQGFDEIPELFFDGDITENGVFEADIIKKNELKEEQVENSPVEVNLKKPAVQKSTIPQNQGFDEIPGLMFDGDITKNGVHEADIVSKKEHREYTQERANVSPVTVDIKKPVQKNVIPAKTQDEADNELKGIADFFLARRIYSNIFADQLEPDEYVIYECNCPITFADIVYYIGLYIFTVFVFAFGGRVLRVRYLLSRFYWGVCMLLAIPASIGEFWGLPESRFYMHYAVTNKRVLCYNKFRHKSEKLENIYGGSVKIRSNGNYDISFKTPHIRDGTNLGPKFVITNVNENSSFDIIETLSSLAAKNPEHKKSRDMNAGWRGH